MKTSRRNWFKAALASSASAAVSGVALAKPKSELQTVLPDVVHYNGFKVEWTGWKAAANDLSLCGQWIARPRDGQPIVTEYYPWGACGVYSSFPGDVGLFNPGYVFDICWREEQAMLVGYPFDTYEKGMEWWGDPRNKISAQRMALEALKKFINEKI